VDAFLEDLPSWQLFYATVGTAAATLTGLLFVSLSLNRERLKGKSAEKTKGIARQTFGDFLYVLMISLVFIVPHQIPFSLTIALLVLGFSRGIGFLREAGKIMGNASADKQVIVKEIGLPLTASLGLIIVAIAVGFGLTNAIYGLVIVVAALLISACWNAWLLLMEE
jgi:VanZ family protein